MTTIRRMPRWVWIAAIPVAMVLLAWLALAILLPPARATRLVQEQLSKSLARPVRFERVSVSLFPPVRLSVRRFELAEPGGFERGAALTADAIALDLDVFALLSRRVKVRRLSLESPALHLLLRADGTSNLDGIGAATAKPGAAAGAPALDLDVQEFRVRGGAVLVDDMKAARRTALTLNSRMSLTAEQGGARIATSGETVIAQLAFGPLAAARLSDLNQGLAKLEWHVTHKGKFDAKANRLALEQLALELGGTQLALSGLVDDVGPRARYDLRARGQGVDLAQVLQWVSVADAKAVKGIAGRGALAFDVTARGSVAPGAQPRVSGVVTLKDAAFRYAGAPAEVTGLSLTANLRPDSLMIPDLRATVADQPVAARFMAWRFADPMVDFAVRGNVDLAAVAPMLATPGTKLAGRAAVDMRGRGRAKDPGTMALGGSANLSNVSVEGAGLPQKVEQVNGRIEFSEQRAAVRQFTAKAGRSSYTLDASVTRPLALMAEPGQVAPAAVDFTFRSPYLDLAELLPTTPGAPFLPNATGGGRVAIDRLKQGRLDVTAVQADVKLSPARLESPRFSLQGYGGTVTGDASFDLRDTRKPATAVRAVVSEVKADEILGTWSPIKDLLRGTLSTDLDFAVAGQTPEDVKRSLTLMGLAAITDGKLGPGPALEAVAQFVKVPKFKQLDFAKAELPMRIQNGRLITDAVRLEGPSGEWRLSGAAGFDGSLDYAVSVTLPPAVVEALGARSALAAGALSDDKGRMLLDLKVGGNAKSPRVSWDTQAMQARLAGRASQALAEQSRKLEQQAKQAAEQALIRQLSPQDSTAKPITSAGARDSLRSAAKGLLEGLLGGKKPATPPAPAPAPAPTPAPAPVPDTTKS
jgi:hypothetical protein